MNYSGCNFCCLVEPASGFFFWAFFSVPSVSSSFNRLFVCALFMKKELLSDIRMSGDGWGERAPLTPHMVQGLLWVSSFLGLSHPLPKLNIRHSHHHERPRSAEKGLLNSIQSGHFPPLHRHKQPPPCVLHLGRAAARQCRDCTIPGPAGQPTSQRSWEDTLVQVCPLLSIISQCIYGAILPPNFSPERPEIFEGFKRNFWQQKKKREEISWI